MKPKYYQTLTFRTTHLISTLRLLAILAMLASSMLLGTAFAQTPQLRYTFEDGPGTTTTSSGALPVVLNMVSGSGLAAVDLHGPANSGVQNQGHSLNLSTNPISGNAAANTAAYAVTTGNTTLGQLGVVSNFTATVWFKMTSLITNIANNQCRFFVLGTNGVTDDNSAATFATNNVIGMNIGSGSSVTFPKNAIWLQLNNLPTESAAIYYDFPTNVWLFVGMTYDSVSGNASIYFGSEASPAKLYAVKNIGAGTNFNFSGSASLSIGNRPTGARDFPGWIDEFRFYTSVGDANFVENVRQASTPVVVSGLTPDGSVLMSGTNKLSFTATSASGVNTNGIKVSVNGTDVSSSLLFTPTTGGQIVTYTNLPVNPTLIGQSILNGVNVSILVTDIGGIVTSNSYVYDAFTPNNFTWEGEDYDFGGGMYIDNPVYSFVGPDVNTYYQEATPYSPFIDAVDNGNGGGPNRVYRDPSGTVETEYSLGGGLNGGMSVGELMRQKVLDAFAVTNAAREVNVGYFDGSTVIGGGLPNWMNYTRTYPSGTYNAYLRVADGGGALTASLDLVNGGWGTSSQTTTNIGTFSFVNSGGWDTFAWVPLRDVNGNLIRVTVAGVNTIRLTAGPGGGGNVNFLMLTRANTNLPAISGIYPNGTNMFQPASALTFTATSPAGVTINPAGISVKLTIQNLLGQTTVTNITTANGLVVTGTATSRNVSAPLTTNLIYTAIISVTDVNGSPASSTVSFDTLSPNYTWEAEDYDYNSGQTIPDPQVDAFAGLAGVEGVDFHNIVDAGETFTYRPNGGGNADQVESDAPRLQYITSGSSDYNIGWYDNGEWNNYTRTYPAGLYNVYLRGANGGGGNGGATLALVTSGVGTSTQTTTNLGTFTLLPTGNWQGYSWTPLRDAGGNLVKFTGGFKTLRATSLGGNNANFYALFPANTNLPALNNVYPNGTTMFQATNKLAFSVLSTTGVSTNSIVVTVNGVIVTNLVFSGSLLNWNVSYPHLLANTTYTVTISATDLNGNLAATSVSFDTFSPANYTWEAEDFDHDGGQFIDNPQTNAYLGLAAIVDVDTHQVNFAGVDLYRPNGMDTEINGDSKRAQYLGIGNTNVDYTVGYFSGGSWLNYTRHYPAGSYNVYGRLAAGNGNATSVTLSKVTGGWGTTSQTTNFLGTFNVASTGWESYNLIPLRDDSGNLVTVALNGSTNTLQVGIPVGVLSDCNVNFLMLVPASSVSITLTATISSGTITIAFPTQNGSSYQLLYKNSLTDLSWTPIGSPLSGNGSIESINQPVSGTMRFYRVQIQ
jgi:hypothetical protein